MVLVRAHHFSFCCIPFSRDMALYSAYKYSIRRKLVMREILFINKKKKRTRFWEHQILFLECYKWWKTYALSRSRLVHRYKILTLWAISRIFTLFSDLQDAEFTALASCVRTALGDGDVSLKFLRRNHCNRSCQLCRSQVCNVTFLAAFYSIARKEVKRRTSSY